MSLFLEEEKPLLAPLPATRFELAEHRTATVQFNYHVAVDKMYYSVPYQYIKDKVDVRITDTTIEIFKDHRRIASHRRLYGRPGQYSTVLEHMPLVLAPGYSNHFGPGYFSQNPVALNQPTHQ